MRNEKSVIVLAEDRKDSFVTNSSIIRESSLEILGFEIGNEEVYTKKNISKSAFPVKGGNIKTKTELVKNLWNFNAICKVII